MDPYCGWNKQKNECTMTPNKNPRAAYWQQNLLSCPVLTDPVRRKLKVNSLKAFKAHYFSVLGDKCFFKLENDNERRQKKPQNYIQIGAMTSRRMT
jgi:hypothetical protein